MSAADALTGHLPRHLYCQQLDDSRIVVGSNADPAAWIEVIPGEDLAEVIRTVELSAELCRWLRAFDGRFGNVTIVPLIARVEADVVGNATVQLAQTPQERRDWWYGEPRYRFDFVALGREDAQRLARRIVETLPHLVRNRRLVFTSEAA